MKQFISGRSSSLAFGIPVLARLPLATLLPKMEAMWRPGLWLYIGRRTDSDDHLVGRSCSRPSMPRASRRWPFGVREHGLDAMVARPIGGHEQRQGSEDDKQ